MIAAAVVKKNGTSTLKGKKVLITGGLGFIGSNLAHRCLELGAKVTLYDCLDPRSGGNLFNVKDIRKSVKVFFHDILDFDQISECIDGKEVIFNCAASTSHPFSMREPWIDMDVNSKGVINILEAMRRFNPEAKLVHLGTTTQFGRLLYQPADENHPERPMDIYSANKSVSEKYVIIYASAHGMRASVVRLSNVFGPRASIHSPEFTFNNYFIGLALQDREVTVYGDGAQKRNVIYVEDAVSALVKVALSERANGEILLAVGDHHYTVAEIAHATVRCFGKGKIKFIDWPQRRRSMEVGDAVISNKKIKALIGWKPKYELSVGLVETKKYFKTCLDEYLD
jgi:UDP-glucose 4-epimerase